VVTAKSPEYVTTTLERMISPSMRELSYFQFYLKLNNLFIR